MRVSHRRAKAMPPNDGRDIPQTAYKCCFISTLALICLSRANHCDTLTTFFGTPPDRIQGLSSKTVPRTSTDLGNIGETMVQLATTAAPTIDWPTIPRDAMRILDIVITLLLLMFFGPLCLAVAICIKATSHGPVIYRQRRIGYLGQEFYCLKFRTMRHDADARLAALLQHDLLARTTNCATIRASPRSASSCVARASTNCRNSSTCCRDR